MKRMEQDFPSTEFRKRNVIGIRSDQSPAECLWLKVHGLGNFLVHRSDQFDDSDDMANAKQERKSDPFAGWLLIGNA